MIRKIAVITLAIVLSQATLSAFAAMHFPGTGSVTGTTFTGTATVSGFGNDTASLVNLHLFTATDQPLTCIFGEGEGSLDVNWTSPSNSPLKKGNATFSFTHGLVGDEGCSGAPLVGTLFATYSAQQFQSIDGPLFATAELDMECDIDQTVNATATCFKLSETHTVVQRGNSGKGSGGGGS